MALDEKAKQSILDAGHRVVLDGSASAADLVHPFDAHDKVLRESPVVHTYPGVDPVPVHDYPKVIASHDGEGNLLANPVVANDANHEAELRKQFEAEDK